MFRTSSSPNNNDKTKTKWSWTRFITNAQPNFANSHTNPDLTPKQQDDLFRFQLAQRDPKVLHELSFYIAGIVGKRFWRFDVGCSF